MSNFGITSSGFVLKTFDEILDELNAEAKKPENWGADVDVSEFGEIGIFTQNMARALADTWEDFEDLYFCIWPDTAEDVSLDRVVSIGGLTRKEATKAIVSMSVSGTNGTTIPIGFKMQTPQSIQFETIAVATAQASGTNVDSRAVIAGTTGIVPANTIIEIVNPVSGLTDVNNALASTGGFAIESDVDLRQRFNERDISGGSSVPAIINALQTIDNVITAQVNENTTDTVDGDGLPAHSLQCIVSGSATDTEIATAIFEAKSGGIATYGSKSLTIDDENGDAHIIYWDEPTDKFINVIVNITSNADWVSSNETAVKTAVVESIGGVDTISGVATEYAGLEIGEDVRSYIPMTKMDDIEGIDEVEILIAFAPATPTTGTKLAIASSESSRVDTSNVTVNVT